MTTATSSPNPPAPSSSVTSLTANAPRPNNQLLDGSSLADSPLPPPPRRSGFSTRNKAALSISTNHQLHPYSSPFTAAPATTQHQAHQQRSSSPHRSISHNPGHPSSSSPSLFDHYHPPPSSAPVYQQQHIIHSPRPLAPLSVKDSSDSLAPSAHYATALQPPAYDSPLTADQHPAGTHSNVVPNFGPVTHDSEPTPPRTLSSDPHSVSPDRKQHASPDQQANQEHSHQNGTHSQSSPTASVSPQHARHPSNSTSSVGPNVAGRIGVGGNVMVDPHNGLSVAQKGTIGAGAFVYKVYNMLLDPSFQHLISFNPNGQSFTVINVQDFSRTVLPKHFKHNNFSSFVRQLNMYGFHKVNKTPRGQRGNDTSAAWEFVHPKFHRGRPDLLEQIRRKTLDSDIVLSPARKDHGPLSIHPQSSPTTPRFSFDSAPYISNAPRHSMHMSSSASASFLSHMSGSSLSPARTDFHSSLPSKTPTTAHCSNGGYNFPDLAAAPLASNLPPLLDGPLQQIPSDPTHQVSQGTGHSLAHRTSSTSPYVIQPPPPGCFPRSTTYPLGPSSPAYPPNPSTPLTPLSAGPPLHSPMTFSLNPKAIPADPTETVAAIRGEMLGRFQGVNDGYEVLYRELLETRRRHDVLVNLVAQMYKTLQDLSNANLDYPFPGRDLTPRSGEDLTPVFRITEHDHPPTSPMTLDLQHQHPTSVSVNNSPAVSEFNHPLSTSPVNGASYRQLAIDPTTFGAFGNLTLSSYPSSPVGLMPEQSLHTSMSHGSQSFPPGSTSVRPAQSTSLTDEPNRLSIPIGTPHQQARVDYTTTGNLSPRTALSAALKIPLPPSPSPFQHTQDFSTNVQTQDNEPQHLEEANYQRVLKNYLGGDSTLVREQHENDDVHGALGTRTGFYDQVTKQGDKQLGVISPDDSGVKKNRLASAPAGKGRKRPASGSMDLTIAALTNRRNS